MRISIVLFDYFDFKLCYTGTRNMSEDGPIISWDWSGNADYFTEFRNLLQHIHCMEYWTDYSLLHGPITMDNL